MKNKLITWALRGVGTLIRRAAVALVGVLVANGFLTEDPTLAEKAVAVFASLFTGMLELTVFLIRTRNGKNIQRAVGAAKIDGVVGEQTVAAAAKTIHRLRQGNHGGRP